MSNMTPSERKKKWVLEHPEQYAKYRKEYMEKNKEKNEAYQKEYRAANKEKIQEYNEQYWIDNKEKLNESNKYFRTVLKVKFVELYGGKCNCCGEPDIDFLTLDHVQNDGKTDRGSYKGNYRAYKKAISAFTPDIYQVLCYNCNHAKHNNGGVCPHQRKAMV